MPVIVSGRTFKLRDRLRTMGGRWNPDKMHWEFYSLSQEHRSEFKSHVGVMVSDTPEPVIPPHQSPRYTPLTEQRRGAHRVAVHGDDFRWFNYFADQDPIAFFGFSSLAAMTRYVRNISTDNRNGQAWLTADNDADDASWRGTPDMNAALELARDGWREGAELAGEIVRQFTGRNALQRRRKHAVAGGAVSIGRLLAGNPNHMVARPKQPGRKIITFFVEAGQNANITAEIAMLRAAIIGAVADLLEMHGYSCEIVATSLARHRGEPAYQLATTIKSAGEKLNLSDVVFALGHPSFDRRLGFACFGSEERLSDVWDTMGTTADAFDDEHPTKPNEYFISALYSIRLIDDEAPMLTQAMQIWDLIFDAQLPITLNRER